MTTSKEVAFGFLTSNFAATFGNVTILPFDDFDKRLQAMEKATNRDGYFYPGDSWTVTLSRRTGKRRRIPKSKRPALIYRVIPSHRLTVSQPVVPPGTPFWDGMLLIHTLAFIFGTRLQIAEWFFEGRIPMKSVQNVYLNKGAAEHFVESVYNKWRSFDDESRRRLVNVLYLYTRATSLEWDWDAFMYQYLITDALYDLHKRLGGAKASRHADRIALLCKSHGVAADNSLIGEIVDLRNDLFHEALWGGASVGLQAHSKAFYRQRDLQRMNARLICALLGYKNDFATSVWWSLGTFGFNKYP